eukprot:TRINITY_DN9625_c0_g1_i2.p1 TRINITY_DN9625_c0_g1~~TRINITY_DN9625_c0_g1_i2.p1  ORF type:complete len:478 (-),score=75.12 TRINITY_DN9625_c0_g1_i2:113-1546(-)
MCIRDRSTGGEVNTSNVVCALMAAMWARPSLAVLVLLWSAQLVSSGVLPDDSEPADLVPLDINHTLGLVVVAVVIFVTAGGGLGAGAIVVPTLIFVMRVPQRWAIPLSNVCVWGCALAQSLVQLCRRHPTANRPLIDFDLALAMEPMTTVGAIAGSYLHKLSPSVLSTWLFVVVISLITVSVIQRTLSAFDPPALVHEQDLHYNEDDQAADWSDDGVFNVAARRSRGEFAVKQDHHTPTQAPPFVGENGYMGLNATDDVERTDSERVELARLLQEEKQLPWGKVLLNVAVTGVVVVCDAVRDSETECPGLGYWGLTATSVVVIILVSIGIRWYLIQSSHLKSRLGYPYVAGDVVWAQPATSWIPLVSVLAGLFAGMFGVGGGLIKGPYVLYLAVNPEVVAGTASWMILFTTTAANVSYAYLGLIQWDYGAALAAISFISGLSGVLTLMWFARNVGSHGNSRLAVSYTHLTLPTKRIV